MLTKRAGMLFQPATNAGLWKPDRLLVSEYPAKKRAPVLTKAGVAKRKLAAGAVHESFKAIDLGDADPAIALDRLGDVAELKLLSEAPDHQPLHAFVPVRAPSRTATTVSFASCQRLRKTKRP